MMGVQTREVAWGDALVVAVFKYDGGLKGAVSRIQSELGLQVGSRNTFGKYLHVLDPADLSERDRFRVWLLLVTLGESPAEWGIPDDVVPRGYDVERLKLRLPRLDSNQQPAGYLSLLVRPAA